MPALSFRDELQQLINRHSVENSSGTPDFILAEYMNACLHAYNGAIHARESWYGRPMDRFGMPTNRK